MVLDRGKIRAVAFCMVLCLLSSSVSYATGLPSGSDERGTDTESDAGEGQEQDGPSTEEQLDELEEQGSRLDKKTEKLKTELGRITDGLNDLESEVWAVESELRLRSESLSEIGQKRDALRESIQKDVEFFYRNRNTLSLEYAIFHFKSWSYLINYSYYVSSIINASKSRIDEYESVLDQYNKLQKELESEQALLQEQMKHLDEMSLKAQTQIADLLAQSEANDKEIEKLTEQLIEEERERMRREAEERAAAELAAMSDMAPSDYRAGVGFYQVAPFSCSEEDVILLASLIQAEAGGYNYDGMVAVGSVVLNRVFDSRFPSTIPEVIYAPGQFYPQGSGRLAVILAQGPWDSCVRAARDVIDGRRNVPYFYYKADWYAEEHGIEGVNIGGNVFHQ